jgi:predicted ATPase
MAKYMGDGILAYFGYPQAHEDDAEQAVRAGLAIVDAVARLGLAQRLAVRLGIATRLVVVGDLIGAGASQEQSVVGDTPNLAAWLQALAGANQIIVAGATRRLIGSLFEIRDLGPQALKGFTGATRAWQVLGESGVASRFEELRIRQLEGLAQQQPVLTVFEDVHWIDPSSLELLDRTIAQVEQLPVLLIATFRLSFQPPWAGQAHVTTPTLSRLGRREGAALVHRLAGNFGGLTDDIVDEIIQRTDGVPLFLEEVTKAIPETADAAASEAARSAIATIPGARTAVPATLQASLLARHNRLGPAAREIAKTGAAIGREFAYELVTAVAMRREAETRSAVDLLVGAGLLFQRDAPPVL